MQGKSPGGAAKILILAMHGHITGVGDAIQIRRLRREEPRRHRRPCDSEGIGPLDQEVPRASVGRRQCFNASKRVLDWSGTKPYLAPNAIIVLDGCAAALAKNNDNSIPAQLAKGSGATVVASMGFTTGDIALGDATITEKHNGLTFGQLVGWYELKLSMKQNNLRDPLNNQVDPWPTP